MAHANPTTASITLHKATPPTDFLKNVEVRPTQPHQIKLVRDLLTDGFWDNPAWNLIDLHDKYPDAEQFVNEALAKLMLSHSYLIYHGDEVIGHVCMTPENTSAVPSMLSVVRVAWQIPFKFGLRFTSRLVDFMDVMEKQPEPFLDQYQPAATLDWFMVKTERRGRGVGLHVLKNFVTKDRDCVLLITQTADGMRLYERAGFKTIHKHKLRTKKGRECDNWCMVYHAKPVIN